MQPLFAMIDEDFKYWEDKLQREGIAKLNRTHIRLLISRNAMPWIRNPWTPTDPAASASSAYNTVLIRNNRWYFPLREFGYDINCSSAPNPRPGEVSTHWCGLRMAAMQAAFDRWVDEGESFPDTVFLLDPEDGGSCRVELQCPAPALAFYKVLRDGEGFKGMELQATEAREWNIRALGLVRTGNGSLLVPDMSLRPDAPLVSVPWEHKARKAVFMGPEHCPHFHRNPHAPCSRKHFAQVAGTTELHLLNVNVTAAQPFTEHPPVERLEVLPPEAAPQHLARFAFTLALDGHSGYPPLQELLRINSLILKEHSPIVEYYTRALHPGVHYLPILTRGPLDVLGAIKRSSPEEGQRISAAAQDFASRFLCDRAKRLYFRQVLRRYKALFSDMDAYIAEEVWPLLRVKMELVGLGRPQLPPLAADGMAAAGGAG